MKHFEEFMKTAGNSKSVTLSYREDSSELLKRWAIAMMNDHSYKYLIPHAWTDFEQSYKDSWNDHVQFIEYKGEPVGFIKWECNHQAQRVMENGLFLLKDKQNYHIAMVALRKWADHVLIERNFRKLSVACSPDNENLFKILQECKKVGLREIGTRKEHHRMIDGTWTDQTIFELSRQDYFESIQKIAAKNKEVSDES